MKFRVKSLMFLILTIVSMTVSAGDAAGPEVTIPGTETRALNSEIVGHVLLAILSFGVLTVTYVAVCSGMVSSNHGTYFKDREPVRFWLSTGVCGVIYLVLTVTYFFLRAGP